MSLKWIQSSFTSWSLARFLVQIAPWFPFLDYKIQERIIIRWQIEGRIFSISRKLSVCRIEQMEGVSEYVCEVSSAAVSVHHFWFYFIPCLFLLNEERKEDVTASCQPSNNCLTPLDRLPSKRQQRDRKKGKRKEHLPSHSTELVHSLPFSFAFLSLLFPFISFSLAPPRCTKPSYRGQQQ